MPLPKLAQWDDTRTALHQAAQVLDMIRIHLVEPLPNALQHSLRVTPQGLTTRPLPFGGELQLNFARQTLVYTQPGIQAAIPLMGHTQRSLADAALAAIAQAGHKLTPDLNRVPGATPFQIDPTTAADYAQTLYSVHTAFSRFRARLRGLMSPVVVWPHGFDMAFILFNNPQGDESGLHAMFGFSPKSPGFDRPYFYTYVHPSPPDISSTPLPSWARWHTQGWTGIVSDYDALTGEENPELALEEHLLEIAGALAPALQFDPILG
jgi:hypothetical protein